MTLADDDFSLSFVSTAVSFTEGSGATLTPYPGDDRPHALKPA